MTAETRQQRRHLERERRKLGERGFARGLPEQPSRQEVVAAAEIVRAKLIESHNPRRAREAAGLAHALAERSLRTHPSRAAIACAKGCSYCCHGLVGAVPPEAFAIAAAVMAGGVGGRDGVRARAQPLIGLGAAERVGRRLPCPLLVDGMCSVYAMRPLVCRQTTSLSLPACIEEFEGTEPDGRIEISSTHLAHASNAHVVLLGAMHAVGLPTVAFELGALLDAVLGDADCEARWLAGEDVFGSLSGKIARDQAVDLVAARIGRELAG